MNIWPLKYTEGSLNRAKQLMRGRTAKALMLAGNRGASLTIPQIVKFNLGKIGIDMDASTSRPGRSRPRPGVAGSRSSSTSAAGTPTIRTRTTSWTSC